MHEGPLHKLGRFRMMNRGFFPSHLLHILTPFVSVLSVTPREKLARYARQRISHAFRYVKNYFDFGSRIGYNTISKKMAIWRSSAFLRRHK